MDCSNNSNRNASGGYKGLIQGYQSIAKYHEDIDKVIIQFVNTTNFDGHTWTILEIVYYRIVKILKKDLAH